MGNAQKRVAAGFSLRQEKPMTAADYKILLRIFFRSLKAATTLPRTYSIF